MAKKLKVVKTDQTVHFVPLSAKPQVMAQNNLLPADKKWVITEVDEAESKNHPWKDKSHVTGAAAEVIKTKDDEIAKLRAQLKAATAGKSDPATTKSEKSSALKADQAIEKIEAMETEAEINAFVEGETRVSVVKASTAQLAEINGAGRV